MAEDSLGVRDLGMQSLPDCAVEAMEDLEGNRLVEHQVLDAGDHGEGARAEESPAVRVVTAPVPAGGLGGGGGWGGGHRPAPCHADTPVGTVRAPPHAL